MIGSKSIIEAKMPLKRLKYTFDYCNANPIGFFNYLILNLVYKFYEQLCRCTYNQI